MSAAVKMNLDSEIDETFLPCGVELLVKQLIQLMDCPYLKIITKQRAISGSRYRKMQVHEKRCSLIGFYPSVFSSKRQVIFGW